MSAQQPLPCLWLKQLQLLCVASTHCCALLQVSVCICICAAHALVQLSGLRLQCAPAAEISTLRVALEQLLLLLIMSAAAAAVGVSSATG